MPRALSFMPLAMLITLVAGCGTTSLAKASAAVSSAPPAPSCALYASTTGSNRNAGVSKARPLRTVQRLLERLRPGQTGCLMAGETFYESPTWGSAGREPTARELAAVPHGKPGRPIVITSASRTDPATVDGRIVTMKGANWLTFSYLVLKRGVVATGRETLLPSPTVGSAHTSWIYDDVSGEGASICFNTIGTPYYGPAEDTLIAHDRIHDCGHPVTKAELEAQGNDEFDGRLNGWHAHGVYDEGEHTTISDNYIYDNSGAGVLLRGGRGARVSHNVITNNGHGVLFGNENDRYGSVEWNVVTDSDSPCESESESTCLAFGVFSYEGCEHGNSICEHREKPNHNIFQHNDVYGNKAGNIGPPGEIEELTVADNVEAAPDYVDAASHDYALQSSSPVKRYGPTSPPVGF